MASIRKNPRSGRWEVRYRSPDGRQRTKGGFAQKADAVAHKAAIEHGLYRGDWRDPALGRVSVEQWCEEYVRGSTHKRATTLVRDAYCINNYLLPAIGGVPMSKVTPLDIKRIFDPLSDRLAPSTISGLWGTISHIFKMAVEADVIAVSPCRGVRRPTVRPTTKRFLTTDEINRLADAVASPHRAFILVAAYAGLRFSELAGLRVGSVDFLRRTLTVSQTIAEVKGRLVVSDVKTPSSRRTLTLPSLVIDELSALLATRGNVDPSDWLFQTPTGGPLRYSNFHRTVWAPAKKAAGFTGLTMHGLRHTSVGLMIEVGAHPRVIQQRLGHSKFSTTMDVYGSVLPEVEEGTAAALNDLLATSRGADVVQGKTRGITRP